jgi:hypothetical protein
MRTKATLYFDVQLWRRFKSACALMNLYPSHVLEDLIVQWLKRNEQKARKDVESD